MTSAVDAAAAEAGLIARYDRRVPRYTSYPTAPNFTSKVTAATYAAWLGALPRDEVLSLYLHVPFCAELCLYCGCHTTVARRYAPVAAYVGLLEREIALVSDILGRGRPVAHIHWGGGTPTILSPAHLADLMQNLAARFVLRRDTEIAVEIDPRTLTRDRVEALAASGVNRASLGVQDFDETVQRTINRIQTFQQTADAVDWLHAAGIGAVSFDLMYGLPHQTVASVARSVRTALQLQPDRIALFGYAHVPWMKRHQALLPESALPGPMERLHQARTASEIVVAAGYAAIGLDHFARPGDPLARAAIAGDIRRNFQGYTTDRAQALIGFGTSSIGNLPQGYVQNAASTVAYREAIAGGRLATVRGLALTPEDSLRAAMIERLMCSLKVDVQAVARAHDADPETFDLELARIDAMTADGIVERDGYRITVPERARPFLRAVCSAFDAYLAPEATRHSRAL